MMRPRISKWQGYRYRLAVPYIAAFAVLAGVGYQLTTSLSAETITAGSVTVSTDKVVYRLGDTVRFTIKNDTSTPVIISNNCPSEPLEVYRQVEGQWVRLRDEVAFDSKCQGEPRQFTVRPSGGTASATYCYWDNLFDQPGRYRIIVPLLGLQDRPQTEFNVVGSQP